MRIHEEDDLLHMNRNDYTDTCVVCGVVLSTDDSLTHLKEDHVLVLGRPTHYRSNSQMAWTWHQKQRVLR